MSKAVGLHLVIRKSSEEEQIFELTRFTTKIGRDATNDIILEEQEVSRKHARIKIERGADLRYKIEDLNSANGTYVNGERLEGSTYLRIGDEIRIAHQVTVLLLDGEFERDENDLYKTKPSSAKVLSEVLSAQAQLHNNTRKLDPNLQSAVDPKSVFGEGWEPSRATEAVEPKPKRAAPEPQIVPPFVFISHADQDNATADKLYDALIGLGLQPWMDHKQLKPGKNWEQEIQNAMDVSWATLLLISRVALKSRNCIAERQYFMRQSDKSQVYVVLLDSFKLEELPFTLPMIQFIDLSTDFEEGLSQLLEEILRNSPTLTDDKSNFVEVIEQGDTRETQPERQFPEHLIYLSHSYQPADAAVVQRVRDSLEKAGINVWSDPYDQEPGSLPWRVTIADAIERSNFMIVIQSVEANNSNWMRRELLHAESQQKPMFAVQLKGGTSKLFGILLDTIPKMQVSLEPDYDVAMRRLITAIYKHLAADS